MARALDASSTQYLQGAWGGTIAPLTMGCWFQANDLTSAHTLMDITDPVTEDNHYILRAAGNETGDPVAFYANDGTAAKALTASSYTTGTWHHACAVVASTSDRRVFLDGGSKGTNTTSVSPASLNRVDVGFSGDSTPGFPLDGLVAEAAIWSVALADADVAILALGISPLLVRPDSLVRYWPLVGRFSPEIDYISGSDLTLNNGPTAAEHPRVLHGAALPGQ